MNENDNAAQLAAPAWATPELLADTLETWQPYYSQRLTVADALDILLSVSRLIDALWSHKPLEAAS
jgi:hypothetical protein